MKLKVMDYWKCAEVGLRTSGSRKIFIVLAESLPGQGNIQNKWYFSLEI